MDVIGILFAFANCISVAMYLAGFSETIVAQYSPPLTVVINGIL